MKGYKVTDADAKEAGINKKLYQEWYDVNQAILTEFVNFYKKLSAKPFLPENKENMIYIGSNYRIEANFINREYISVRLYELDSEIAEFRSSSRNHKAIAMCLLMLVVDSVKVAKSK